MNILKTFKLTWFQAAIFKIAAISFGMILAVVFPEIISEMLTLLVTVFIAATTMTILTWLKQ